MSDKWPILAGLALVTNVANAAPVVQIRGEAHLQVRWHRDAASGLLVVEGQVLDDVDRPLPNATVVLDWVGADGAPLDSASTDCADRPLLSPELPSDGDGRFCVRLQVPLSRLTVRGRAKLTGRAAELYDAAPFEQIIDFDKLPVSLWLEGDARRADLEQPTFRLDARLGIESDGRLAHREGLTVRWHDERDEELGSATTDAQGRVHFEVPTARLGEPGLARHRLRFAGASTLGNAELAFPLEKRAPLQLSVQSTPTEWSARTTVTVTAKVTLPSRDGAERVVPGALVQAWLDGVGGAAMVIGAAESDAHGDVVVPITLPDGERSTELTLRATSSVPFLTESAPHTLPIEIVTPRSWRSWWLLGGFGALLGWLALGRVQRWATRAKPTASKPAIAATPVVRAEVRVQREQREPRWSGSVQDAHDRTPVPGARISLLRPAFAGAEPITQIECDDQGCFELHAEGARPGDRLRIEAPYHRTLEVAAPAFGNLQITAISRRRGLLVDFASWASRQPWASALRRKPTPLDAARASSSDADWAEAVDAIAFGPREVDRTREQAALDRLPGERRREPVQD